MLDPWAFNLIVSNSYAVNMPDGANIRKVIADLMHKVQKKVLEVDEGDTKSIFNIVHVSCFDGCARALVSPVKCHLKNCASSRFTTYFCSTNPASTILNILGRTSTW